MATAKTKLVDGKRIDIATGQEYVSTPSIRNPALGTITPTNSSGTILNAYDNAGNKTFSRNTSTGFITPALPQSITSENLSTTGTPFVLPQSRPTPTQGANLLGQIEAQNDYYMANETAKEKEAARVRELEMKSDKSTQDYIRSLVDDKGEITRTAEKYAETVDPVETELKEINQKIREEKIGLQRQIEAIEKNKQGMFGGAMQQEVQRTQTESLRRQADLSITQLAIQGRYDSAKAIADRAVAAELEQQRQENDILKTIYEDNKDKFTTAEQRQFETMQKDRERNLNQIEADKKTLRDTKLATIKTVLENGAPPSIALAIQQAETPEEAQIAAGQYLQDPFDKQYKLGQISLQEAQLKKLNAEIKEMGTPAITNINAGQYSQALSVILGSGKFTKDQKASVVSAINSGEDPAAVIRNQAKNIMGQTLATALDKNEQTRDAMIELDKNLKDFYSSGGETGIFKGNFEKVANKLGQVKDPLLVDLAVQVAASLQKYRNAISGTAYSEQEGKDIASIFPGINKGELLNSTIVKARLKTINSDIDSSYRNTLGSAYDALKPKPPLSVNPFTQSLSNIFNPSTGLFNIPD